MPACNTCGGFVTADFARVFGNNADTVYGCAACSTTSEILSGKVAADSAENDRPI